MSDTAFADCHEAAHQEIAEQIATDVLIIEDEVLIARDLANIMTRLGHRVIANVRTRTEAIALIKSKKPGLVLADIRLADESSGIDAVNDILDQFQVPVVFITAYPDRLLTGLRPEPTFLISKPYSTEEVRAVVSQLLFFDTKAHRASGRHT
jgi:two-component SAPR family response regulator